MSPAKLYMSLGSLLLETMKYFWTLSVWKDKSSFRRFTMREPHATAVKKFQVWAGEGSAFVEWSSKSNKIDWTEALQKLRNPT